MLNLLFGILLSIELFGFQDTAKVQKEAPVHSHLEQKITYRLHQDYSLSVVDEKSLTILSAEGLKHGMVVLGFNKLQDIKDFQLEMIEPLGGKTIKKARLKDMTERAVSSSDFLLDDRYKYFELSAPRYPVLVKIRTEILKKSNFYYPEWMPVKSNYQKVKESTLIFHYPTEMGLKFKELNLTGTKETKEEGGITTMIWIEKDLEVQTPSFDLEMDPKLLLAPVKFAVNEFQGEMNDWAGLASWQNKLNEGRGELPESVKNQILSLVKDANSPFEKVAILYDYLQRNYRYVSIQLGIGGWQTMTAKEVVDNKFGDCKALTNFMKSMLEVAGIPSFYTLVNAGIGEEDIEIDLPSNQFNHVILKVPTDKDPIWLECTSNLNPPGYLGNFTSNRHVLVITPDGGYLSKTPTYLDSEWNKISSHSKLSLDTQGAAQIESIWENQGNPAMLAREISARMDDREKRDYLNQNSAVAGLIVQDFSIKIDRKDSIPTSEIKYEGVVQRFTQSTAKRLIFRPFLARITASQLSSNFLEREDSYEILLPDDLEMEGGNQREIKVSGTGYEGLLTFSKSGKTVHVLRKVSIHLDPDLKSDQKSILIKEINTKFDHTPAFVKTTLSTLHYE